MQLRRPVRARWRHQRPQRRLVVTPNTPNPPPLKTPPARRAVLNLIFHGTAMFQMLWDERRIHFKDPEHEALWRFFYRRSGMGKLEFKQVGGMEWVGGWWVRVRVQGGGPARGARACVGRCPHVPSSAVAHTQCHHCRTAPPLTSCPASARAPQTVKHSRRAQFKAGEVILGPSDAHTTLMLLLEGFATYTFKDPQACGGLERGGRAVLGVC